MSKQLMFDTLFAFIEEHGLSNWRRMLVLSKGISPEIEEIRNTPWTEIERVAEAVEETLIMRKVGNRE